MSYLFSAVLVVLVAAALFMPEASEARSYNGTWKSSDGLFVAKIKQDKISIDLRTPDMSGLYWKGTFKMGNRHTTTSRADTKALEYAIFGSSDRTKTFVEKNGALRFHFQMLDIDEVVSLRRSR